VSGPLPAWQKPMTILNPKALILAALAVPVVLLYLWRVRPRRRSVSTGFLWEQVFAASERRSAWWPYRHPVSLCVQLAVLGLLVLALAEPHLRPPATVAMVIDNSASMSATDVGPSRLDRAKELAQAHIGAMGQRDRMALVSAGDPLRVPCGLTDRRDALEQALASVAPTREGTRVADAVELARQFLRGERNGRVLVFSDGCFDGATELARQDDVELIAVGGLGDNVGITRLEARRSLADPFQCQVLAEVTSYASEPVACRLALELDGRPIDVVPIELDSAGRWQRVFEMTALEGGPLGARLDRPDVFLADNRASARVPRCPVREVVLVTGGNATLEEALRACPRVRLTTADALPQERAPGAILVLDRQVPNPLPQGPILVVDPAEPCELWQLGERAALEDRTGRRFDGCHHGLLRLEGRAPVNTLARVVKEHAVGDPLEVHASLDARAVEDGEVHIELANLRPEFFRRAPLGMGADHDEPLRPERLMEFLEQGHAANARRAVEPPELEQDHAIGEALGREHLPRHKRPGPDAGGRDVHVELSRRGRADNEHNGE